MDFASVDNGGTIDLVCSVMVFENEHTGHLLKTRNGSVSFLYDGCLTAGFTAYTLFNVCLITQFPVPKVAATKDHCCPGSSPPYLGLMSGCCRPLFRFRRNGPRCSCCWPWCCCRRGPKWAHGHSPCQSQWCVSHLRGCREVKRSSMKLESVQRSLCGFPRGSVVSRFRGWEMEKANWTPVQVVSPKHWMLPIFSMPLLWF